ncbi:MAG: hypothetical protein HY848_09095 [Betaproteobacteria bacterium]|nr:hypothetical protein [Betaproteobacteria bacterium]
MNANLRSMYLVTRAILGLAEKKTSVPQTVKLRAEPKRTVEKLRKMRENPWKQLGIWQLLSKMSCY